MKRVLDSNDFVTHNLSRRKFVTASAGGIGAALLGMSCKTSQPTEEPARERPRTVYDEARIDWQQAKGQELTIWFASHPWSNAITPLLPRFTELSGIKVNVKVVSEMELLTTLPLTLSAGSPTPDAFMVCYMGTVLGTNSLEPLDGYYADSTLTDLAWYDENDIFGSARDFALGLDNKTRYAVALTAEAGLLILRKDLLDAKGLAMPKTYDDLYTVAKALKSENIAGIALRGKPTIDASWPHISFILSHGGEIVDEKGVVVFDGPEGVAAVEMYAKLLREAGPANASTYSWYEVLSSLMQGTAAATYDVSNFAPDIEDAAKSKVAGKVVYGSFPTHASKDLKRNIFHWMLGMNTHSKQKKAAWLFLQWATSKPTCLQLAHNRAVPARSSTWQDPGFRKIFVEKAIPTTLDYLKTADGSPMRRALSHPRSVELCTTLSQAVNQVLVGASDAKTALAAAAKKLNTSKG